ncbi:MAG: peptidoglycan DD-metalloendopeptidase family protein [Ignavibacteria bacterium]|jgi:murein DD-endopeptidase MepM/ murein hydrolase activator NlpD|nr:peptidoglycan DD-metalloendopeptidase family protein [Ignavibacteria bacterium]MCU7501543.1 peptidoglycan DD-metalloendopeptidase family protein [Ignavibacteria bacterium]MCU7517080.1 peptidoglycan DD-metalloendopeptidase family protein [Ignavibacteria bacterium]
MNKFYYFSKTKLKLIEISNFHKKFLSLFIFLVLIVSCILFGGFLLINSLVNSDSELSGLKAENKELSSKLSEMASLYKKLDKSVDSLTQANNELRTATDLPAISGEERALGTGGGLFEKIFSKRHSGVDLDQLSEFVDQVKTKISFERSDYLEISNKLKSNKKLFEAIPAIKPADGVVTAHGFGMRMHPILGVVRMHEGIDIVADIGTPVYAPGSGTVAFVGTKGGFGLCIEIDHGFGYRTVMGHLSETMVTVGQKINRGTLVAKTGNTGLSTGPHLHYEVHHNGLALNPEDFFFDDLNLFN